LTRAFIHWRRCKSEKDTRLCGIANDDKDVEDTKDVEYVIDTAAELIEDEREVSLPRLPGVSKEGKHTLFIKMNIYLQKKAFKTINRFSNN